MDFVGEAWSGYMNEIHTNCSTSIYKIIYARWALGFRYIPLKNVTPDFKNSWVKILTNCSIELINLLVVQYRADLQILDQELIALQTKHEAVKNHVHFD